MSVISFVIGTIIEIALMIGAIFTKNALALSENVKYYILFGLLILLIILSVGLNVKLIFSSIFPFTWYYLLIQTLILIANIILTIKCF